MSRLESSIERAAVLKIAQLFGVMGVKFSPRGLVGYPDRIFLIPGGKPIFMEFKRPKGRLSAIQEFRCSELEKLGYIVVSGVTSVEDAVASIKEHLER